MNSASQVPIARIMTILDKQYPYHPMAVVTHKEPFKVLICCLLSLRSRDIVTMPVCSELFQVVSTPQEIIDIPADRLASIIQPVQFYRNKVEILKHVSDEIQQRFNGKVPNTVEALESIKGIGRKTANLVLQLGFDQPAIAVDTHVHRICNRLGYVQTKTPEQTENALRQKLPLKYWNVINRVMVRHGQEVCIAGYPRCDICCIYNDCKRVGVTPRKSRSPAPKVHHIFIPT